MKRPRKLTVELEYLLPAYTTVHIEQEEGETLEQALNRAIEDCNWDDTTFCYDASGPTYVSDIVEGHRDNVYVPGTRRVRIPKALSAKAVRASTGRYPGSSNSGTGDAPKTG